MAKKVILGLSGGVDSSVAAYLLQKDGYEVVGITMSLINKENDTSIEDARKVCEKLGIEHHVLDLKNEFKKELEQTPASVIVDNASNSDELERSKQELKSEFRGRVEKIKNEFFKK
mgnify:CR=1 FL=1